MDFEFLGEVLPDDRRIFYREKLIEKLENFFNRDRIDGIPISCQIISSSISDKIESHWFSENTPYIVYMENYEKMILSKASDFVVFLNNRELWQDFDVCIFDEHLSFCVALTHNDEAKFVSISSAASDQPKDILLAKQ